MSQADELLNSLSEEDIMPLLSNPDTEPHIVIGEDRIVAVPEELKRIAVQYDHDVETVTFDCPRYWDGLDMSELSIYINYRRKDKVKGCYRAENIVVDADNDRIMHFDWTISRNVSLTVGPIQFLVCVRKADEDGYEKNHWNSELNEEMYVSEGLECEELIIEPYPDIISQLNAEVEEAKNILLEAGTQSAANAKISEANAKTSEENAKISETHAVEYMNLAATSEKNAKTSEINSATSEANAKQSEENAAESETAAQESAELADDYSKMSKSYAVGGSGVRDGEDTDNSKYYSEVAQDIYNESLNLLNDCEQELVDLNARAIGTEFMVNYETGNLEYISPLYYFNVNTATGNLEWSTDAPAPDTIEAATATDTEIAEMLDEVFYGS